MRILVTGGAGFIGSHLVDALLARGDTVRVLDNFSTGHRENLRTATEAELLTGDINDFAMVDRASTGVDCVYHLAALTSVQRSVEHPMESFTNNTLGTFNVFEAARRRGVKRLVYASSAAVYGENPNLPLREAETPDPLSPYALDKVYAEQLAAVYARRYGLDATGLRFFNVYGPRQDPASMYSGVISIFVARLLRGAPLTVFGDGEQSRDFVYVGDVVRAAVTAGSCDLEGARVFNIAGGRAVTLRSLIATLEKILSVGATLEHMPSRPGDIRHSLASIDAARSLLDWQPECGLEQGLRHLCAGETRSG